VTPLDYYQQLVNNREIAADPGQLIVIEGLQHVYHELLHQQRSVLCKIKAMLGWHSCVKGVYLWGEVGVGKSFMIDLLYSCLPFGTKLRIHFHAFMHYVHEQLRQLQGHKNPLDLVAKQIAQQNKVLCFDEFVVNDIADAMLLAGLLKALFRHGVCLLTSSNFAPDRLYEKGLQRQRFLSAIELLKQHTHVIHLTSHKDYRLRHTRQSAVYFTPLNKETANAMALRFDQLVGEEKRSAEPLRLFGRSIDVCQQSQDVIWFDFLKLCGIPRSQRDFLLIAKRFSTIMVSDVPVIKSMQHNLARNIIKLVDVLYDAKVRLIISAAAPVRELYPRGRLTFEFARTVSRLIEMQAAAWPHIRDIHKKK